MSTDTRERIDDLQRAGCRIIQRPELFCFGMDAVLLAAWAVVRERDRVLDLCSGNGIVPILMDARLKEEVRQGGSIHFTGVEINPVCVDMARRSALMNGQADRIRFLEGDIRWLFSPEGSSEWKPCTYDCVTVNPPYMTGGGGLKGPREDRAIARHEVLCTMADTARAASRALRQGGHLYLVHRPHRLGDIFRELERNSLGIRRLRMVHPFSGAEANLVLIDAAKGGRTYVHVEAPLIVYREKGVYTEELKALYG